MHTMPTVEEKREGAGSPGGVRESDGAEKKGEAMLGEASTVQGLLKIAKQRLEEEWHHCSELRSNTKAQELGDGIKLYLEEVSKRCSKPPNLETIEESVYPLLYHSSTVEEGLKSMVSVIVGVVDFFAYLNIDLFSPEDDPQELGPTKSILLLLGKVNPDRRWEKRKASFREQVQLTLNLIVPFCSVLPNEDRKGGCQRTG
jgi:hypothetical protein